MESEQNFKSNEFDAIAQDYDEQLHQGLSATGEDKHYYAKHRIQWVKTLLDKLNFQPQNALDFGCGNGTAIPYLINELELKEVAGVDVSPQSLAAAEIATSKVVKDQVQVSFKTLQESPPTNEFDLAFCNGVFHHIKPAERSQHLQYIHSALKKGGYFCFWENNPLNLGTRYVMSKIPFDRDAITLTPWESKKLLEENEFTVLSTTHKFLFPKALSFLRPLEQMLIYVPFMAQYLILCRK